jgi:hypothetical protein
MTPQPARSIPLLLAVHLLFWTTLTTWAAWRYDSRFRPAPLPVTRLEPITIPVQHSRPPLVDEARLTALLQRLTPRFSGEKPTINHVEHALRLWGAEATFTDEQALSGAQLRELLLDHRVFAAAWGPETKALLMPVHEGDGLRFRSRHGSATSSHVDHTLATLAEIGTPLDFPVITTQGEVPLVVAVEQSLRDFSLYQTEYEWSVLTYLHYLPEVRTWTSAEGEQITWDRIAGRLMDERRNHGVCFGQHRLYALAAILIRDQQTSRLSPEMQARVVTYLADVTQRLQRTQAPEGYWTGAWQGAEWDGPPQEFPGPLGPQADRLVATGHILEWWAYAPPAAVPPDVVLQKTSAWLLSEMEQLSDREIERCYPFLTHAARALILWHGRNPLAD